jgi:hypothetical protein
MVLKAHGASRGKRFGADWVAPDGAEQVGHRLWIKKGVAPLGLCPAAFVGFPRLAPGAVECVSPLRGWRFVTQKHNVSRKRIVARKRGDWV